MASVAEGLEVRQVQWSTAFVDGDDVVDHLCRSDNAFALAFFADRIHLELDAAEVPPFPALVKVRVVMAISLVRFFLRKPRPAAVFLYDRHISGAGILR